MRKKSGRAVHPTDTSTYLCPPTSSSFSNSMIRLTPNGPLVFSETSALSRSIQTDLTQSIEMGRPGGRSFRVCVKFYVQQAWNFRVPLAYVSSLRATLPVSDTRTPADKFEKEFIGSLRPQQESVCQATMTNLDAAGCVTLVLPTGGGKTVCALHLIALLGLKPIILVHKTFLAQQWKERIHQYFGDDVRCSMIKGSVVDTTGDVVIGLIQTFVSKKLRLPSSCGTVVVDEAHHIAATQFKHVILSGMTNQRYVLGLSATPQRKDGLDIQALVGKIVTADVLPSEIPGSVDHRVLVKVISFTHRCFDDPAPLMSTGDISYSSMVTTIVNLPERTKFISSIVVAETDGRDTLILTQRRQHCVDIVAALRQRGLDVDLYIPQRNKPPPAPTAKFVVSTYAFVSEGFDLPRLQCVVFAAPAVNIEQSVGRVLRSPDASPVIIDVADVWSIFNAQTRKRRAFYHSRGFVVVTKGHWVGQGNPDDSMVDRGRSSRDSFPNNGPAFVNEED